MALAQTKRIHWPGSRRPRSPAASSLRLPCSSRCQETSRLIISRLCAIFPATALNKERLLRFRRLMVLGCVSIYKHVHSVKDFEAELQRKLVTKEELALFSRISTIYFEEGHDKSDKFPTKNRRAPALIPTPSLMITQSAH